MTDYLASALIYLAEREDDMDYCEPELRLLVRSVNAVLGVTEKRLTGSLDFMKSVAERLEPDPSNPNINNINKRVADDQAVLEKYCRIARALTVSLQLNHPELYAACVEHRDHEVRGHPGCSCYRGKRRGDNDRELHAYVDRLERTGVVPMPKRRRVSKKT